MKLYNTLTKQVDEVVPVTPKHIGIYSCGPTVYWNQHIGHMYAYVQWDVLVHYLRWSGYKVTWAMNVTDVGHLTGENDGNPDVGEDKMEKGAKREGVSVEEIAKRYIAQFEDSLDLLNIAPPDSLMRATQYIDEQIKLAEKIEANGFAYKTNKGLVFDTSKFPDYAKFAGLKLDAQQQRADVTDDPDKKSPWDFFLWAIDPDHVMKWDSPWGVGYPGWHLECTAMSTVALGDKFDIHTGGIEHIGVHHTNEIAQGVAAYGANTANFWVHNAHLMGKGGVKMSKSLGNFVTVQELVAQGFDPLALRYLYLNSHYRKGLNFTTESLESAQNALNRLRNLVVAAKASTRTQLSSEKQEKLDGFRQAFTDALDADLNIPEALSVVWQVAKSNIPNEDKYDLLISFDEVLGLNLREASTQETDVPADIRELAEEREELRNAGKFEQADKIRKELDTKGYLVQDAVGGARVIRK